MFYRRKIILALLQLFDGELEKIRLQKLLFLFSKKQPTPIYDFVPYKYGCFSYSANADLTTMVGSSLLLESENHFKRNDQIDYLSTLKLDDRKIINEIKLLYGKMSSNALMKHTYVNYPFFAINSVKTQDILTNVELQRVVESRPKKSETILFTIGYEGISLEEYLNRLIRNDVKILVDVRNNPLSMKYGFSKSQLKRFCENLGLQYMHFPELGIQSDQRQELKTQKDYDNLFEVYLENNLKKTSFTQIEILNLLKHYKRIALTCFEADICQCHRTHLANAISALPDFKFELKHI